MKVVSILLCMILLAVSAVTVLKMNISDEFENVLSVEEHDFAMLDKSQLDEFIINIAENTDVGELPPEPYDYTKTVPETEPVEDDFFSKCVFIGDSRTVGLIKYTDLEPINYASVGFSLAHYDLTSFVKIGDKNFTVQDALRENDDFTAVYVATGVNELGWSISRFIESYEEMIDDIMLAAGDRPIYLQLILPVTTGFERSKYMNPFGLKNSRVSSFNQAIMEMAIEKELYVLDCSELFLLEDGTLDPKQSSDGAHLTFDAYDKQYDYYKRHVVGQPRIETEAEEQ